MRARVAFWDRLDRAGECWLWTAAADPKGYGVVSIDGRLWKAHRYAWSLAAGREPAVGVVIVQSCGEHACCRPEHLLERAEDRLPRRRARRARGTGSLGEARPGVWELRVSSGQKAAAGSYGRVTRMFHGTRTGAQRALAEAGGRGRRRTGGSG